jgi:hypothetical protein
VTDAFCLDVRPYHELVAAYIHFAPPGVPLDRVLMPEYWRRVAPELARTRWSGILAISESGEWEALLRVTSVGIDWAKVRVVSYANYATADAAPPPDGYTIEFLISSGWRALSPAGEVVCAGQALRAEAVAIAQRHADAIAAKSAPKRPKKAVPA